MRTDSIYHEGRRYTTVSALSEKHFYSKESLTLLCRRGKVKAVKQKNRWYICDSDFLAYLKNPKKDPVVKQVMRWLKGRDLSLYFSLVELLAALRRDGVKASKFTLWAALRRIRQRVPRMGERICAWLLEDPARRRLSRKEMLLALELRFRRRISPDSLDSGLRRFDRLYGGGLLDLGCYMPALEAAEALGLRKHQIRYMVQSGRLQGVVVRHRLHVSREQVEAMRREKEREC